MTEVFSHAVASFDPTVDAVLLWTRLAGGTSARWVLARNPDLTDVVASGEGVTGPARDGTIVVDATGLEPSKTYWYRFTADGVDSPVGRTRTLPGSGADGLVLGLVSCANYSAAPGQVVSATNTDSAEHTVTSDQKDLLAADNIEQGKTVTFKAPTKPGTYTFHCEYHASMHGALVVK